MIRQEQMQVVKQSAIATNIFELTLTGQLVLDMKQPGQFVHLRVSDQMEPLLRRPISISSINEKTLEFTMIYRAEGRGTTLLSERNQGTKWMYLDPLEMVFRLIK